MGNCRKFISLMICAMLCFGMIIPALAADIASAPVKGGNPLAGIDASNYNIWCYDSAESINGVSATINAYVTRDGVRTTEMKYTVDPNYGVKCAATVYEPVGGALGLGDHRITTAFVGANKLIVDCNYVAVTYLTSSTAKNGLVFRNSGGSGSVKLTEDTSVSGGKWVTVYAPITGSEKTNIITRMNKSFGNMGLVWDGASDANETLYVREIVFFKNEADVKAYAAASPVCYNGDAYVAPKDEPKEEPKTEDENKPSTEVTVPVEIIQDGNKLMYDSYDPFTVLDSKSYNIWRYDSAESLSGVSAVINAYVTKDGVRTTEMEYTVDPKFGVKCAATVCEPVGGVLGLGNHRITTAFVGTNKLTVDLNYVAVTYLTKSNEEYGLVFRNTGGAGSVKLTDDTSASHGKWTTVYAPITGSEKTNIITRMNKSYGNMGLVWNGAKKAEETLYVREIVFFENEADAVLYAEVAPAFYMGEKVVKKLPKTDEQLAKLNLMAAVISAMRGARWAIEDEKRTTLPTEWIEYEALFDMRSEAALDKTSATHADSGIVTYITEKNDEAAKLEFTPGDSSLGYYRISFTPDAVDGIDIESGNYYAAVTYRADTEAALTLTAGNDSLIIAEETAVSTKWQTASVKIDANSDILKALANGNDTVTLGWGQDAPNGSIEIKELVFFFSDSRVEDYEEYAPSYYNSFYDWSITNPLDSIKNEVVIDFSNGAELNKMLKLTYKTGTQLEDVKIDGISAIKLSGAQNATSNNRHFTFVPWRLAKDELARIQSDNYYAAITFMTDGIGDIHLFRYSGAAGNVFGKTVASDKWQTLVCSAPMNSDLMGTLLDTSDYGSTIALEWINDDLSKNIYIKEIVFFNNEADAEKYGEGASKYYNYTAGYEKADAPQTTVPTDPLSGLGNYDKWTFDSEATLGSADGAYLDRNNIASGTVFTKDPNFGVKSLKIKYCNNTNVKTYYAATAFKTGIGEKLRVTPKYIAVTYMTSDTTPAAIGFNAIKASGVIVDNTSSSNGRWTTGYVKLDDAQTSGLADRLSKGGYTFAITWSNTNQNSEIYIREVVFFENEADAIAYTEKAPAYYNYAEDYSWNVDPLEGFTEYDFGRWNYTSAAALSASNAAMNGGSYTFTSDPTYGVESIKPDHDSTSYSITSKFSGGNWISRFGIDLNYIAVTYMTPSEAEVGLDFWAYNGAASTITTNTSVSDGKWVTAYVKVEGRNKDLTVFRLNEPNAFLLTWNNTATDQSIYVREIVFFENEADVKAYAAKAPVYYNYYSK